MLARDWGEKPGVRTSRRGSTSRSARALGQMDFETAAKLSGSRFAVLRSATWRGWSGRWPPSCWTCTPAEFGYTEVLPPFLVRDDAMFGTGPAPEIRRGPVPHGGRLLADPDRGGVADQPRARRASSARTTLPLRFTAWTPCFRAEAGRGGQGHARADPPAPVLQGGAGVDRRAGAARWRSWSA